MPENIKISNRPLEQAGCIPGQPDAETQALKPLSGLDAECPCSGLKPLKKVEPCGPDIEDRAPC